MEPKPSPPPAANPRRRGAATKREEKAASAALSASPPPKRQARERVPVDPPPAPRSRPPARKSRRKPARKKASPCSVNPPREQEEKEKEEEEEVPPPPPPPRPSLEQEIEAVLSRGAGVHVVPTFAGWFSWKGIHPIEKQMLATFFDGKSELRTPKIYMAIRNLIMSKFHFNPEVHLEAKDLSELSIGKMDARLEILEFLSHWGLVNFHPFPPGMQKCELVESKIGAGTADEISLVEKLFQFETVHSYLVPVPKKADVISPVQFTSLLAEPTLVEDAVTTAESSVEYHCNSCSVDCSRKRYHCRTQVDFDLCSDCYNVGKFDEGMSNDDFILMEYAEVPGSGGSNWTDQETLLLLEALEIFKGEEWDEIAEHVATKTKEQCMLHFLQMPIFDSFLDGKEFSETPQKITQDLAETGTFDVPEEMDVYDNAEGKESTDEKTFKKADANSSETGPKLADQSVSAKEDTLNPGDNVLLASAIVDESNKSSLMDPANKKTLADVDVSGEHASNFVIDVLRSTFEIIGHFLDKEDLGSFAEAGNPGMALAAFFASVVEREDAVTSCCNSLRAISETSPALQLATGHCFILPDPPSNLEDPTSNFSPCTGDGCQGGAGGTRNVNATDKDSSEREESALALEEEKATFTSQKEHMELSNTKESFVEGPQAEVISNGTKDSDNRTAIMESSVASDKMRDGCSATSTNTNEPSSIALQEASAASTKGTTNPERAEGNKPSSMELPDDGSPSHGKVVPEEIEHAPVASSSMQQHESNQTGNGNTKEPNSNENIIAAAADPVIRLQRAAATTLSAAAVKAKLLAEQEEDHIRQLAALVIEKQFQKMEAKMSFLSEVGNLVLRSRELTEKMRKKLMLERSAIIASRMAVAASRTNQHGASGYRLPLPVALVQQLRRP